jgi:hypothetical protein
MTSTFNIILVDVFYMVAQKNRWLTGVALNVASYLDKILN